MADQIQPWERQPDESARQYAAFAAYRDLGPRRSLAKAYGRRPPSGWYRWSTQHSWVERASTYDTHTEALQREAREARIRQLEEQRFDFEFAQQAEIERRAAALSQKIDKLLQMPNTDIRNVRYSDDGSVIVQEQEVKGIRLSEIAALNKEWRELIAQGVNGHVKITKSGRLPDPDERQPSERMSIGVVWEKWPETQEPSYELSDE